MTPLGEPGRSHAHEPYDADDLVDAAWLEHVEGDGSPENHPPSHVAPADPERIRWHSRQILRIAIHANTVYAGDIAQELHAGRLGEAEAWALLEAKLNEAGFDTSSSTTRFLVFPEGTGKTCRACLANPDTCQPASPAKLQPAS